MRLASSRQACRPDPTKHGCGTPWSQLIGCAQPVARYFRKWTRNGPPLFGYLLARSAELGREILKLRQTIFHGEYSLGIVHVDARAVF